MFSVAGDSMLFVDKTGRRVVNEKLPYNELAQLFFQWDPLRGEYPYLVLVQVWDQRSQDHSASDEYGRLIVDPGTDDAHVLRGETFDELAGAVRERLAAYADVTGGLALADDWADNLRRVDRPLQRAGRHRLPTSTSAAASGRCSSCSTATSGGAGPREPDDVAAERHGPYYAALVTGGTLDTKGGPKATPDGQVVDDLDRPIPGLYGVGNCVASPVRERLLGGRRHARPDHRVRLPGRERRTPRASPRGGARMAVATQTMTDEQRKSVALEYLKAFDNGGVTSTGESILELFATDAQVMFPKWGIANGREEIGKMFGDVGSKLKAIRHDYANFNWIFSGGDTIVAEGTSYGEHEDGPWRAGVPSGAPGAGATSSRSATSRSSAASSTSTPTTRAATRPATRGWPAIEPRFAVLNVRHYKKSVSPAGRPESEGEHPWVDRDVVHAMRLPAENRCAQGA